MPNPITRGNHDLYETATLGEILGAALAARDGKPTVVDEKPIKVGGMWHIIMGDPSVPKKDWEIHMSDITDPHDGVAKVKAFNADHKKRMLRYAKGGQYYSEVREDGLTYYSVQVSFKREEYDWDTSRYIMVGEETFTMLTSEDARAKCRELGRTSFWIHHYEKPYNHDWVYSMRKVPIEQDYMAREAARTDPHIKMPPELLPQARDNHYQFLCAELIPPNMVSFFKTREDAWENRRTKCRLGKFLRDWCDDLNDDQVAAACAKVGVTYTTDVVLKMARTREEMREVYINGPRSCMSGDDNVIGGIHPVESYAAGDLALAYLERDGDITARALCNPAKMQWVRIYGDEIRLATMLKKLGYRQSNKALGGAKLLKIEVPESPGQCFLPYLDGDLSEVTDMGDHFEVYQTPERYSGNTSGYVRLRA